MQLPTTHEIPQAPSGLDLPLAWQQAWNHHAADMLAALVAPDIDFVTVAGLWLRGRHEFHAHHRHMHATQMSASIWTTVGARMRMLDGQHALQHVEWRIEGDRDSDGSERSPRRGIFTWVLQLRSKPLILAGHNTNLAPHLSHRLTPGA
jgi:uncharacterized protein (TIGR02246 family)